MARPAPVMMPRPPAAVVEIARRLSEAGHDVWAVGGAVRDALFGRPSNDWDLATSARPPQVRGLFRRTVPIGIEHGTVGVLAGGALYEVTTFRRDVETFGRHAVVAFADSIGEDLARRDFTINAIAWSPLTDELLDPYAGLDDLRAGVLRTVGDPAERFAEDYLRVLRAIRFAGQFGLHIDPSTWSALAQAVPHLKDLSAERVREELWKVFANAATPSAALDLYREAGVLDTLLPELAGTVGLFTGEPAGDDVWRRTLRTVDALPRKRPLLRMAALLHAVGYPAARTRDLRGGWRFTGHTVLGARKAADTMRRLRASNAETARIERLVGHQEDLFPPDAGPSLIRRWLRELRTDLVYDLFRLRIAMWRADPVAGGDRDLLERWRLAHHVLLSHPVLDVAGLAISGTDLMALGLAPGPRVGELLRTLLDQVLERPELNTRDALLDLTRRELAS